MIKVLSEFIDMKQEQKLISGIGVCEPGKRNTWKWGEVVTYGRNYEGKEYPAWVVPFLPLVAEAIGKKILSIGVSAYGVGSFVNKHIDNARCGPTLAILSLGGYGKMVFEKKAEGGGIIINYDMVPRSLMIIEGEERWEYTHEILPVLADRWSIAFRT